VTLNKEDLPHFNLESKPERQRLRIYCLHMALSQNSSETETDAVTRDAELLYKFISSDEDYGVYEPKTGPIF
jgi:hypothetical protein